MIEEIDTIATTIEEIEIGIEIETEKKEEETRTMIGTKGEITRVETIIKKEEKDLKKVKKI